MIKKIIKYISSIFFILSFLAILSPVCAISGSVSTATAGYGYVQWLNDEITTRAFNTYSSANLDQDLTTLPNQTTVYIDEFDLRITVPNKFQANYNYTITFSWVAYKPSNSNNSFADGKTFYELFQYFDNYGMCRTTNWNGTNLESDSCFKTYKMTYKENSSGSNGGTVDVTISFTPKITFFGFTTYFMYGDLLADPRLPLNAWQINSIQYSTDYDSGGSSGGSSSGATSDDVDNIIINQNQNTQDIIDNQNQNTQDILDSNKETQDTINNNFNECRDSYNLMPNPKNWTLYVTYNASYSINSNDVIVVSASTNYYSGVSFKTIPVTLGKTYTISAKANAPSTALPNFRLGKNTNSPDNIIGVASSSYQNGYYYITYTFTADSDYTLNLNLYPSYKSGNTENYTATFYDFQLQEGTTATKYEEFGQEICTNRIDKTNDILNDLNNSINDDTPPNLSSLENSAGWLPPGPVDSVLNLPLSFLNNLIDNLGNSCQPVSLTLPYVNKDIELPCVSTIYEKIGLTPFLNWTSPIISCFILFGYLINLYKWVDATLTLRENTHIDNWGGV